MKINMLIGASASVLLMAVFGYGVKHGEKLSEKKTTISGILYISEASSDESVNVYLELNETIEELKQKNTTTLRVIQKKTQK